MRPPGDADWKETPVEMAGAACTASVAVFADTPTAQAFVEEHWDAAYQAGAAPFIREVPSGLGEPVEFTPTGLPCYRPTPQPPEVWFLPGVSFADVWSFAKRMWFLTPDLSAPVADACDSFLEDLASRHPIGIEAVGGGVAMFRRYKDGGAFDIAEMRRACELNLAVLGGPQDASHRDKGLPRHFVKRGFFYFGI